MNEQVRTGWIFAGLLLALAFLSALSLFLPQGTFLPLPEEELVFPLPVLALINGVGIIIIYGGLGWLGLNLARKLGFPELYDEKVTNKERFFYPGLAGVAIGAFLSLLIWRRPGFTLWGGSRTRRFPCRFWLPPRRGLAKR